MSKHLFEEAEVISSYSRAQAIADGMLIDVSATAREAGITCPCVVTQGVWVAYVKVPRGVTGQDESGRLWDILWLLKCAIRAMRGPGRRIDFSVRVRNNNRGGMPPLRALYALCGPGDAGEPVITVMLPDED